MMPPQLHTAVLCAAALALYLALAPTAEVSPTVALDPPERPIINDRPCPRAWTLVDPEGARLPGVELTSLDGALGATDAHGMWVGELPCQTQVFATIPGLSPRRLHRWDTVVEMDATNAVPLDVLVVDAAGDPLPDFSVHLEDPSLDGEGIWVATTDDQGVAHFDAPDLWEWSVRYERMRLLGRATRITPLPTGTLTTSIGGYRLPFRYEHGTRPHRATVRFHGAGGFEVHPIGLPEGVVVDGLASCGFQSAVLADDELDCADGSETFEAWNRTWAITTHAGSLGIDLSDGATLRGRVEQTHEAARIHAIRGERFTYDSVSVDFAADGSFQLPGLYPGRWHIAVSRQMDPPSLVAGTYVGMTVDVVQGVDQDLGTLSLRPAD